MWRSVDIPGIGLLSKINETICKAQSQDRVRFSDFVATDRLLIVSDYAGDHQSSQFETYSFLILGHAAWTQWEARRRSIRQLLDLPRRRLSYSRLRDRQRQRVLPLLLHAAGSIQGLSFTLAIAKACGNLFVASDQASAAANEKRFGVWKPRVWERAQRITTFVGFLVAGLSAPNQDVFWVSDEDEIASNQERLEKLTEMLATISSNLLPHNLGNLRCGTTAIDDGTLQLEDLAAIPDLVAGSAAALSSGYAAQGVRLGPVIAPAPASLGWRAHAVMDWMSDPRLPLTRLVLIIEPELTGSGLSVKRLRIHSISANGSRYAPRIHTQRNT